MTEVLRITGLCKNFGGVSAVVDFGLVQRENEITGIIGPNGAGKTTLFNVINGVYPPNKGQVTFNGEDVTGMKPYFLARRGMARTHQIVRPLNEMTVRENVMVGACFGREERNLAAARRANAWPLTGTRRATVRSRKGSPLRRVRSRNGNWSKSTPMGR